MTEYQNNIIVAKYRSVVPYNSERFFISYELNEDSGSIKLENITKMSPSGRVLNNYNPDTYELEAIYKFLNRVFKNERK